MIVSPASSTPAEPLTRSLRSVAPPAPSPRPPAAARAPATSVFERSSHRSRLRPRASRPLRAPVVDHAAMPALHQPAHHVRAHSAKPDHSELHRRGAPAAAPTRCAHHRPLLEKELGQPVNVVNRTGGSGVVGHPAIATRNPTATRSAIDHRRDRHDALAGPDRAYFDDYTPLALVISIRPASRCSAIAVQDRQRLLAGDQGKARAR